MFAVQQYGELHGQSWLRYFFIIRKIGYTSSVMVITLPSVISVVKPGCARTVLNLRVADRCTHGARNEFRRRGNAGLIAIAGR
jgi:hypothetical protein